MKAITIFSMFLITILGCNCKKATTDASGMASNTENNTEMQLENNQTMRIDQNLPVFEYEAMSRGYFKKIVVNGATASIQNTRDAIPTTIKLSASDVEELNKLYNQLDLSELANYKAPSQDRFHDGAPIANLQITAKNETFRSTDFDGGNPPTEIKKIVEKILAIADKK